MDTDGRLMQGDQILSVNSEDVRSATQEAVAALLKVILLSPSIRRKNKNMGSERQVCRRTNISKNNNAVCCAAVLRGAYKNGSREI